ncbi:MAG: hypothetical protein WC755_07600 [Candidatus Woesearchaeota archaeon]
MIINFPVVFLLIDVTFGIIPELNFNCGVSTSNIFHVHISVGVEVV